MIKNSIINFLFIIMFLEVFCHAIPHTTVSIKTIHFNENYLPLMRLSLCLVKLIGVDSFINMPFKEFYSTTPKQIPTSGLYMNLSCSLEDEVRPTNLVSKPQ